MSALSGYITQVQRLLHDASGQFWSTSEITDYLNSARIRVVRDTGSYRRLQTLYLSTGVEVYSFGGLTGFNVTNPGSGYTSAPAVAITGGGATTNATATATVTSGKVTSIAVATQGVGYTSTPAVAISGGGGSGAAATGYFIHNDTIDAVNLSVFWGNSRRSCGYRDWSTFNTLARSIVNYVGPPVLFSVYSYNSFYVAKIPDQTYQAELDSVVRPPALVDDTTVEVIPVQFQDPIQYFAAHLAKIKEQSWGEGDAFMKRYDSEVIKAINSSFTRRLKNPYAAR